MDVLEQRRRRGLKPYDDLGSTQAEVYEKQDVEAALSQGLPHDLTDQGLAGLSQGGDTSPSGGIVPQPSVSPGMLERGLAGPTASPFHSDKVRDEVELLRRRPTTLDADAEALRQGRPEGYQERKSQRGSCV